MGVGQGDTFDSAAMVAGDVFDSATTVSGEAFDSATAGRNAALERRTICFRYELSKSLLTDRSVTSVFSSLWMICCVVDLFPGSWSMQLIPTSIHIFTCWQHVSSDVSPIDVSNANLLLQFSSTPTVFEQSFLFRPVTICIMIIPKLYMSDLYVIAPPSKYSGVAI